MPHSTLYLGHARRFPKMGHSGGWTLLTETSHGSHKGASEVEQDAVLYFSRSAWMVDGLMTKRNNKIDVSVSACYLAV